MTAPRARLSALLLAAGLAVAAPSRATTVARQTLESLTDQSDVVVRGTVERVEVRAPANGRPFRLAWVRVTEDESGAAPARIPVRLPGGVSADGLECAVAGTPVLAEGDDLLLFLSRVPDVATAAPTQAPPRPGHAGGRPTGGAQPREQWQPVALSLGTWRVTQADGDVVVMPDAQSRGLEQVASAGATTEGTPPGRAKLSDVVARVKARKGSR